MSSLTDPRGTPSAIDERFKSLLPDHPASAVETRAKVVLVVDDEPMVRMLAVDLFEEIGCEVIAAANGVEALAMLEERPDISLMFTDCRMPGMSGPDLAEAAAKRWPALRIVLVTGYHNMKPPPWPLVSKPYDARTIERVVDTAF